MPEQLIDLPQWAQWLVTYKEALRPLSWVVASFGGVFAALMAVRQLRETRLWKKTELAKNVLDEIWKNDECTVAMALVDWTNRPFVLPSDDRRVRIKREEVLRALRTDEKDLAFTAKEVFIRDCFDSLLDALQRLEHYIEIGLIEFEDVQFPLEYTVAELSGMRSVIDRYIKDYGFRYADRFLNRYDFWVQRENHGRSPCEQLDDVAEPSPRLRVRHVRAANKIGAAC